MKLLNAFLSSESQSLDKHSPSFGQDRSVDWAPLLLHDMGYEAFVCICREIPVYSEIKEHITKTEV